MSAGVATVIARIVVAVSIGAVTVVTTFVWGQECGSRGVLDVELLMILLEKKHGASLQERWKQRLERYNSDNLRVILMKSA